MTRVYAFVALSALLVPFARAVELKPATVQAFDRYINSTEARLNQSLLPGGPFL